MDETALDVAVPNPPDDDMPILSDLGKVDSADDLVGKTASIIYEDNLPPSCAKP